MKPSLLGKAEGEKQRDKKKVLGKAVRDLGRGLDPSLCFPILTMAATQRPPYFLLCGVTTAPAARKSGTHTSCGLSAPVRRRQQLSLAGLVLGASRAPRAHWACFQTCTHHLLDDSRLAGCKAGAPFGSLDLNSFQNQRCQV